MSCRLRHALDTLSEPLADKAHAVVKETFLSKQPSKSVQDANEEYFASHKTSASHVQAVLSVRHALKPGEEKAQDLLPTLEAKETTLEQAVEGLRSLEEFGAARDEYCKKAGQRWTEADVFKTAA